MKSKRPNAESVVPRGGGYASSSEDKQRGGNYISARVTEWRHGWAIQHANDMVLEPNFGEDAIEVKYARASLTLTRLAKITDKVEAEIESLTSISRVFLTSRVTIKRVMQQHRQRVDA